jgi:hypothetical protein
MITVRDEWRFDALAATLATSRGAAFLRALSSPAQGHENAIQEGLATVFRDRLRTAERTPVRPEDVVRTFADMPDIDGAALAAWIEDLPNSSGQEDFRCALTWRSIFLWPQGRPDETPPGVRPAVWTSLRAAGAALADEGDAPRTRYLAETTDLRRLATRIEEWGEGPFSDLDLELAKCYDWEAEAGVMWTAWSEIVEHALTLHLWAIYTDVFSAHEKDALVAWRVAEHKAAVQDSPELADLFPDPAPCHPDEMLRRDA